ncbi:transposase [Sphingobium sp. WCS2017Hpa-17]|uniref:transposase n=1 Tax=Sphingobium sp. WCS2017Hpa-17 TaxID=3073638 RepID=UPI00288A2387|nr:transposase [Sphingobium sp. WCS2017Hpa-17]
MDAIPAGPGRRRWSAEAKARIIASSFEPGANIAEIARTHGLLPQHLYAWRHDSIPGKRLASKKLGFVPVVVEDAGGTVPANGGGDEIVNPPIRLILPMVLSEEQDATERDSINPYE